MKSFALLLLVILAVSAGVLYFGINLGGLTPMSPEAHVSASQTAQNGTTYIEATLTEADHVDQVILLDKTGEPVPTVDGGPAVFRNPTSQIGRSLLIPRSAINGSHLWVRAEYGEQSKVAQRISLKHL